MRKKIYQRVGFYISLATAVVVGYFLYRILSLGILPQKYVLPIVGGALVVFLIIFVLWVFLKHIFFKLIAIVLTVCLVGGSIFGAYYLDQTVETFEEITTETLKTKKTISVYALKLSAISTVDDLEGRTIGILETSNREKVNICLASLGKDVNVIEYTSSIQLVNDFRGQVIDCMCIDQALLPTIEEFDGMENLEDDIFSVFDYSYYIDKVEAAKAVEVTEEPFTILISGIDTRTNSFTDSDSRSDVNLVVSVNPQTRQVFMLSIPRDYYVTTVCDAADGCANGQKDKLTHTGWHGISTTEKTIENLLDMEINYNVRVNFATVTTLVDLLGGVDIYSEIDLYNAGNGNSACTITSGWNHVNGECALAFSRERYAYASGDRQRGKNQMEVLTAVMEKMISPDMLKNFTQILNSMSSFIETNMNMDEIFSLVNKQLDEGGTWTVTTYSLDGDGGTDYAYELGDYAYVMYPNEDTIHKALEDFKAIRLGETPMYATTKKEIG